MSTFRLPHSLATPDHHRGAGTLAHHHHRKGFPAIHSHGHTGNRYSKTAAAAGLAEVVILAFALVTVAVGMATRDPELCDLAINFVAIILEAVPFMMVGAAIGGVLEVFLPAEFVERALGGHTIAMVFVAAGMGMVFPVCECGIVPIVRRLIKKGVPLPAAIAFLLGVPIVNPLVAASTWLAYRGNWGMVLTRTVCGYIIAVSVSLLVAAMFRHERAVLIPGRDACEHGCTHGCGHDHDHHGHMSPSFFSKVLDALCHTRDDFFSMGKFLIIGAFVAALARATINVGALQGLFAAPIVSILAMMGLALALNVCSQTDAFIAAGFRHVFPATAQMAFMVLGPMLDLKLALQYFTVFKGRLIGVLSLLTFVATLACMIILHYGFGGVPGAG